MLNQIVLVGRLYSEPILEKDEEKDILRIVIAVPRPYKNKIGEYETDYVECIVWNSMIEHIKDYCHVGDVLGIKGRIEADKIDGEIKNNIIAEKITFLSSHTNNDKKELEE